jgi:hypothetical protein
MVGTLLAGREIPGRLAQGDRNGAMRIHKLAPDFIPQPYSKLSIRAQNAGIGK